MSRTTYEYLATWDHGGPCSRNLGTPRSGLAPRPTVDAVDEAAWQMANFDTEGLPLDALAACEALEERGWGLEHVPDGGPWPEHGDAAIWRRGVQS